MIPAGAGLTDALKVSRLLDGVFTDLPLAGALQKAEPTNLGDTPAYLLTDRVGAGGGKIYVSADGKADPLRIVSTKGSPGVLYFTEWNAVPPFGAPPATQQIKVPGLS